MTDTEGLGKIGESAWRSVDKLFLEHARRMDAMRDHLTAHDEMNAIQNGRIDKLVERLDRAYTKIHTLEKKLREQG